MKKFKIAILLGSLRADSYNKKLVHEAMRLAPDHMEFEFVDIAALPHFNEDLEDDFPKVATEAKNLIESSDAVLFASPEYNHNIPGFLKNGIDWISRPGHGKGSSFAHKPAAVMGASTGRIATARMQFIMRELFSGQNMHGMNKPELQIGQAAGAFDDEGKAVAPFSSMIEKFMAAFDEWIQEHQ